MSADRPPHAGEMTDAPLEPHMPGDRRRDGAWAVTPLPEPPVQLLTVQSRARYAARWARILASFAADPARAVREADTLVTDLMEHLATTFAEERERRSARSAWARTSSPGCWSRWGSRPARCSGRSPSPSSAP